MHWLPAYPANRSDGCVGVNHPYLPVQTPYQEQSVQVELVRKVLAFVPLLAWNQSDWDGGLHPQNRFSRTFRVVPLSVGWFLRASV